MFLLTIMRLMVIDVQKGKIMKKLKLVSSFIICMCLCSACGGKSQNSHNELTTEPSTNQVVTTEERTSNEIDIVEDESTIPQNAVSIIVDELKVFIPFEELVDIETKENTETEESAENAVRAENIEGAEITANISDAEIAENSASAENFQFEEEPALQDSAEKTTLEEDALAEEFLLNENENIALPKSRGGLLARAERKNDEDF